MKHLILAAVLALPLSAVASGSDPAAKTPAGAPEKPAPELKPAPPLEGTTVGGAPASLAKILADRKPKETWVLFWATWCPPCAFELPEMERLANDLRGSGFELVTVNVENMNPDMAWAKGLPDYIQMMKLSFTVIEDRDAKLAEAWGIEGRLPTLFRLDGKGRIVAREIGFSEELFRTREKGLRERLGVPAKK